MEVPHTFVRTVKAQDLRFNQVDGVLHDIKTKNSPTWVIFSFADPREKRNTLKVLASGHGSISDQSKWPPELFAPNALCYGLTSVDCYDDNSAPTNVLSFCWKGRSIPIYLRTKYAEFNYVIRTPRRRPRSSSRRFVTNEIEFTPEVTETVHDIRSDASPFNWAVCGYDNSDAESVTQKMVVVEKGMVSAPNGLYALKGIGGITSVLEEGSTMYIYLRVDIPLHRGTERIVSKYVLVTWQGMDSGLSGFTSDDEVDLWFGSSSAGERSPQRRDSFASNSKLQRAVTAHVHGSDIYRVFPHHIPFDATVAVLRKEISLNIGIPENRQRIVWIRQTDDLVKDAQASTAVMLENEDAEIRKDIGLAHGDKIHVDDKDNGENSVLAKLFEQINLGTAAVSLSAERRHEVQRGVEAREAELRKILSVTHYLIRRKASQDLKPIPRMADVVEAAIAHESEEPASQSPTSRRPVVHRADSIISLTGSISEELAKEDVSTLQEQARVLESQNQYLEIPYESIHILGGKENELGCGKAATVYRGLWMHRSGAAEVAVKSFRYARLTDKILGDYRQEVALLRKLRHPNIVLFIGACTDPKLMILTEYCSRKSLYEFKVRMMLDAARGIQYLHSKRIIHRDIKVMHVHFTYSTDIYEFADVVNPFIGMAPIKFYNKTINAGLRPPMPEGADSEYIELLTECWKSDATDRPSFDVIVARLERMLLALGASIDLPPTFQGGYHQAGITATPALC
ncbi:hypothetical protein BBJ28_00009528 [Nothophytophthora sp. Chile5]|nr:hypothetical protein BBJ28_00009528 [Nothophytophthora sp. Chile5]